LNEPRLRAFTNHYHLRGRIDAMRASLTGLETLAAYRLPKRTGIADVLARDVSMFSAISARYCTRILAYGIAVLIGSAAAFASGTPTSSDDLAGLDRGRTAANQASDLQKPSPDDQPGGHPDPTDSPARVKPGEPFGAVTTASADEVLAAKWRSVRDAVAAEAGLIARCRVDAEHCPDAARRFLAIIEAAQKGIGRARLGEVNRAVNLALRPMSDLAQYGVADRWALPLDAIARGAGDCEDYAIAKYAALRAAGVDDDDLRLMLVRDLRRREDHAVLAARLDGRWLILDNRRFVLLEAAQLPDYLPLFSLSAEGVGMVVARSHFAEVGDPRPLSRARR
jgi:predicted transglutaminase-like cysteine proteinase